MRPFVHSANLPLDIDRPTMLRNLRRRDEPDADFLRELGVSNIARSPGAGRKNVVIVGNRPRHRGVVGDVPEVTELGVLPSTDFDAVYRAEYADALRLAVALTGDRAASEDLVQEAFTRLYRNFATIERPGGFLRVALVNLCRNRYRGARRESARLLRLVGSRSGDPSGSGLDGACEVLDILDRLPYRQRAVLVQRYWLGWSEAEIATALDCRPGTVKSLAARALAKLKEDLS